MSPAHAFRQMLAAAAIPLALAGCDAGSWNEAQGPVAAANETAGQTTAGSTPTRTGYAEVEGGRIAYTGFFEGMDAPSGPASVPAPATADPHKG